MKNSLVDPVYLQAALTDGGRTKPEAKPIKMQCAKKSHRMIKSKGHDPGDNVNAMHGSASFRSNHAEIIAENEEVSIRIVYKNISRTNAGKYRAAAPDRRRRKQGKRKQPMQTHRPFSRAGDGNRTHVTSLEGWSSTIELHPRMER